MSKIAKVGPQNAVILDSEKSVIEKDDAKILVIDEELSKKLNFIKQGEFVEEKGATALKLADNVHPIEKIEVVREVKQSLLKEYPYSAKELIVEIKKTNLTIKVNKIYAILKDNGIKDNLEYSAYNFRNKKQEDDYTSTKKLTSGTPSIYNNKTITLLKQLIGKEE